MMWRTKGEVFLKSSKLWKYLDNRATNAVAEGRRKISENFSKYRKHRKTLEDWTADERRIKDEDQTTGVSEA